MGLSFDDLFPGRFLKSGHFKGRDVTLTMRAVRVEELEGDKGKEQKPIVTFDKTKRELVLNRTNGEAVKAMFGRDIDKWIGKRVTFCPMPMKDSFTGEDITAIRVRGSPDIEKDITFSLRLARKKPHNVTLKRTGVAAANGNGKAAEPTPTPTPTPGPKSANQAEMSPEEMQEIIDGENASATEQGL